jgi:hypothetical protein
MRSNAPIQMTVGCLTNRRTPIVATLLVVTSEMAFSFRSSLVFGAAFCAGLRFVIAMGSTVTAARQFGPWRTGWGVEVGGVVLGPPPRVLEPVR